MRQTTPPRQRKGLNADALVSKLRTCFESVRDTRRASSISFPLKDCLLAGYAMFSLKDPSLLAFQARAQQSSLNLLYRIDKIPSDTQMREILDPVELEPLHQAFADVFAEVQRGGLLKDFVWDDGRYLVALDGTGYFCSSQICCPSCLERKTSSGEVQYSHQAVVAVLVHPQRREVIPLGIEPIVKQDGESKNDCERNASRRLLERIRRQHPRLKMVITEDGLSSNGPHIKDLERLGFSYILGAKPGDHQHLFDAIIKAGDEGKFSTCHTPSPKKKGNSRATSWVKQLPLNASHPDLSVNVVLQTEYTAEEKEVAKFSWVTNLPVSEERAVRIAEAGRSRWRIENETFNTLKNQGYHFEHNYGHGKQNLSSVLAILMLLAFLVDQIQQACCPLFQDLESKYKTRRQLWQRLRSSVECFVLGSFDQLYRAMLKDQTLNQLAPYS